MSDFDRFAIPEGSVAAPKKKTFGDPDYDGELPSVWAAYIGERFLAFITLRRVCVASLRRVRAELELVDDAVLRVVYISDKRDGPPPRRSNRRVVSDLSPLSPSAARVRRITPAS